MNNNVLVDFVNRNKTYRHSKVSDRCFEAYANMPASLIDIWQFLGFGYAENGLYQFVNPHEFIPVLYDIDLSILDNIVFAVTVIGDLIIWNINDANEKTVWLYSVLDNSKTLLTNDENFDEWFETLLQLSTHSPNADRLIKDLRLDNIPFDPHNYSILPGQILVAESPNTSNSAQPPAMQITEAASFISDCISENSCSFEEVTLEQRRNRLQSTPIENNDTSEDPLKSIEITFSDTSDIIDASECPITDGGACTQPLECDNSNRDEKDAHSDSQQSMPSSEQPVPSTQPVPDTASKPVLDVPVESSLPSDVVESKESETDTTATLSEPRLNAPIKHETPVKDINSQTSRPFLAAIDQQSTHAETQIPEPSANEPADSLFENIGCCPSECHIPGLIQEKPAPINHNKTKSGIDMTPEALSNAMIGRLMNCRYEPCIRMNPIDRNHGLLDSKIGGPYYIPAGQEPPRNPQTYRELFLLAQINFNQLPKLRDFPETGLLQIFFDPEPLSFRSGFHPTNQISWCIRYYETICYDGFDKKGHLPGTPNGITTLPFSIERYLPLFPNDCMQQCSWEDFPFNAMLNRYCSDLMPENPGPDDIAILRAARETTRNYLKNQFKPGHANDSVIQMGGFPTFNRPDPRSEDPNFPGIRVPNVLLLQLPSFEGFDWGGGNIVHFFISRKDLRARDFSHVLLDMPIQ